MSADRARIRQLAAVAASLLCVVALVAVGGLAADDPKLVAALCAIAGAVMVSLALPKWAGVIVFVAPLAALELSAFVALCVLLGALLLFARQYGSVLHPVTLYGIPVTLYVIVGGANISTYRGTITNATLSFILIHVLAFLAGIMVLGGTARRNLNRGRGMSVLPEWRLLALVPGAIGVVLAYKAAGLAIVHPPTRANIGGLGLLLSESLEAALLLFACHAFSQERLRRSDFAACAGIMIGLAMAGYRGWPVVGLILVLACGLYFGRVQWSVRGAVVVITLIVFFVAGGEYIRRNTESGRSVGTQLTIQQEAVRYDATRVPTVVLPVHFAIRETVGLSQVLFDARNHGRRIRESLLLGDFKTLLPGKQTSGLVQLKDIIAIRGPLGLTAGAVGVSYMDLGIWSLLLFALVGGGVGIAWRLAARDPRWAMTYFLVVVYSIQWFHRGTPKASYLFVPLLFWAVATLAASREKTRASEPALPKRRDAQVGSGARGRTFDWR